VARQAGSTGARVLRLILQIDVGKRLYLASRVLCQFAMGSWMRLQRL
jgi:hypothetical protein